MGNEKSKLTEDIKNRDVSSVVKTTKTLYSRRKKLGLWGGILLLGGWYAYNNVSLPSDWVLYDTLLLEAEKHRGTQIRGTSIRLKFKELYPGEWQKVCFYGRYQGRGEILRDSGIDIQPTRARVWAGSEFAMTFLFVYADGTVHAQRVDYWDMVNGVGFSSGLGGDHPAMKLKLPSCGDRDSVLAIEVSRDPGIFYLILYPFQKGKS